MLQEADPSGEGYLRFPDGVPTYAEPKEGYWDGAYTYIEDDKFIFSTQGYKIDIYCTNSEDFICNQITYENCFDENLWETLSSKIEFNFSYAIAKQRQDRINGILDSVKKEFDSIVQIHKDMKIKNILEAEFDYNHGWTYFQSIEKIPLNDNPKNMVYDWIILDETGKRQDNILKNKFHIVHTDKYEAVDNGVKEGYKQWIKKTDNE